MASPFTHAIVRTPSASLTRCELLHADRQTIDFQCAAAQHQGYVAALEAAGLTVAILPSAAELPDATFVEDALLVINDTKILCRPGAASRRAEVELLQADLPQLKPQYAICAPGTLDGGDVLRVERTFFVGQSTRTNAEGIAQFRAIAEVLGFEVKLVPVAASLHLKTAITSPMPGVMLANPAWVDRNMFREFEWIPVPRTEPWGANVLPINGRVLVAASAPKTASLLQQRRLHVQTVDISELQKAEAGLTCLSVLF